MIVPLSYSGLASSIAIILIAAFHSMVVHAFTFSNTKPAECDDLTVSWSGGQPPFRLVILSPQQRLRNISIPSSAFQDNAGSFTTQLTAAKDERILLSMSDATGETAGGITEFLTVGPSANGNQCDTSKLVPDFFFSLDSDLEECRDFPFTQYTGAVLPITIVGFIPSGNSIVLNAPVGDSYVWRNTLAAGTTVSFAMHDSLGREGGVSDVRVVKSSGDKSCLDTPSTLNLTSSTTTSGSSTTLDQTQSPKSDSSTGSTRTNLPDNSDSSKHISTSTLAGIVVGGVAALVLLALLVFCLFKRRPKRPIMISNSQRRSDFLSTRPLIPSSSWPLDHSEKPLAPVSSPPVLEQSAPNVSSQLRLVPSRPLPLIETHDRPTYPSQPPSAPQPQSVSVESDGSTKNHDFGMIRITESLDRQPLLTDTNPNHDPTTEPVGPPPRYSDSQHQRLHHYRAG